MRTSKAYAPGIENSARINATLLALVRNEELEGMLQAMDDLERTWNHKFNYPWTFFNEVPFSEEFKKKTRAKTKAECRYGMPTCRPGACVCVCVCEDQQADTETRTDTEGALGDTFVD
jgi:Glycolipid 2-alpha-mannosyltransferase